MEEAAKLLGMAIAGGLFAMVGRFARDRWKHNAEFRAQESKLTMEESREHQVLNQQGESYQIQQIKALMRERQKIHESDKEENDRRHDALKQELQGLIGNAEKRLDACEKDRVWLRVIIARMIESDRGRPDHDRKREQDFFRPVEREQVEDDIRVEEAKKKEDDSAH